MPIAHPVRPRRRRPRVDEPPFTGSHWVARTGLPVRTYDIPSGNWIVYKGRTYIAYQGVRTDVSGQGPVPTNWHVGAIVSSADGLTWSTVFDAAGAPIPPAAYPFRKPGQFFIRDDTLYCLMSRGGWSYVQPFAYLAAGEIAIWKTTDGILWEPHQTLVSWPAAGTGQNVGGVASGVGFGGTAVWHAAGSGPAGAAADWLVVTYDAFANVPVTPVAHRAVPQYQSLDGGETWTFVRNMRGVHPFPANNLGPATVFPVPRPGVAMDRWVMVGGDSFVNYSDDSGATWTPSSGTSRPEGGFIVPVGGIVYVESGSGIGGPTQSLSCDYGGTRVGAAGPGGATGSAFSILPFPASVAGGEEMIAATKRPASTATIISHSTNGGETWTDMGDVPTAFAVQYTLAQAPSGRILLYAVSGGSGATTAYFTCDDAPTGIPTLRSICPFVVEPPATMRPVSDCAQTALASEPCAVIRPLAPPAPAPVGLSREALDVAAAVTAAMVAIQGCSALTFVTEPCGGIAINPIDTCAAPLGRFLLGFTCLGAPTRPRTGLTGRSLAHVPR